MADIDVGNYVKQIQNLQNKLNDSIVRRNTQISKKQSILQQISQLQAKCKKQFGCSIQELRSKRDEYQKQLDQKIANLKKVLKVDE